MTLEQQRALARARARARAAQAQGNAGTPGAAASFGKGVLSGATNVILKPIEWLQQGMAAAGVPGAAEGVKREKAGKTDAEQRLAAYRRAHPNWFTGGEIVGETAATAPFLAATGAVVSKIPGAARIGKAITSGGIGVTAPSRTARMALRAVGGGVAGAEGAALTGQDVTSGAGMGAAIPIIGSIGKHGLGWTYDMLARRVGKTKAANILRELVKNNVDDVKAALANASDDVKSNTAQFLAKMGIDVPELSAATQYVARSEAGAPLETAARARGKVLEQGRAVLRGGETGTQGVGALATAKRELQDVTAPMREEALSAADVGRTQIIPAERQAAEFSDAAADEVQRAKRFLFAGERRAGQAQMMDELGDFTSPGSMQNLQILRGEAGALEQRGAQAAERSLALGVDARNAAEVANNLRVQGLNPLNVSTVVASLRKAALDAADVNPDRERVLTAFANNLERRAARMGGVIDATGLYELRKNMGATIAGLLPGMEPKALQAHTAQIIGETQPMIDAAIEQAGGKGWRQYLDTFANGMRKIERDKFTQSLADLPEEEYTRVMQGNDPDRVASFFGPGRYDVNVEMLGPKLPTAQGLSKEMQAGLDYKNLGLQGLSEADVADVGAGIRTRTQKAMAQGEPNLAFQTAARLLGGSGGVYGGGIAAERLEREYANKLYGNVLRKLAPALANPAEARGLMDVVSTPEALMNWFASRPIRAQLTQQGLVNAMGTRR